MYETWTLVTAALALGLASVLLYRKLKDPLRSVPGPFLAKITGVWVILLDLSGNRTNYIHKLHQRYGRVVRVAPNQLCFASPEALKDIYAANSRLTKAPVYQTLGFRSTFTTIDRHDYRLMKKRILPSFSPAFVAGLEPIVQRQGANLIKCFDKRIDQPLDVLPWFRMLALSVVGEGFAGKSFGGLETEKTPQLLHDIDDVFPGLWVRWMFPTVCAILQHFPINGIKHFLTAPERFKKYCEDAYRDYLAQHDPKTRDDLIARFVNERSLLSEKSEPIPFHVSDTGVVEEITNLLFAGTDTTGLSLSYLFWQLAHHPGWMVRMREELKEACGTQDYPAYSVLSELPVLDAVIYEQWRLWPVAPSSLPRVTPEGGVLIDGIFVPENTIVSCQAFTEQRNPTIFPDPDDFNPQRWLDASKTPAFEAMREQITLFGKGARSCLGRRIATMEIKVAVAAIVKHFNVEIGSATTDEDMAMTDHFALIPKGGKCILRLTKYKYASYLPVFDVNTSIPPFESFEFTDKGTLADRTKPHLFSTKDPDVSIKPITPRIGTEVKGLQLSQLSDVQKNELALLISERGVVISRDRDFKDIGPEKQKRFGEYFGRLHVHPVEAQVRSHPELYSIYLGPDNQHRAQCMSSRLTSVRLHSDVSYEHQPPAYTILTMLHAPPTGGDTIWASQVVAYKRLSDPIKKLLEDLRAEHPGARQAEQAIREGKHLAHKPAVSMHPIVRVHPVTGEKALLVNVSNTKRIVG
ncbi:cytochrome P450 [Exophiala viscosa]|uniref:Cytochrome P450 n=1 Tax=Exophiala viscosa TaxID=2486360 RepID=A0AAN6E3Z3_9EURO|nr:cytochrome P450 [Exophiala viscosa]